MRGNQVQISVTNLSVVAVNFVASFSGSYRQVQSVRAIEEGATGNILFQGQITPGANLTSDTFLPLWSGEVGVSLQPVGTAGQSMRVRLQVGASNNSLFDKTYVLGTTPADLGLVMIFPRTGINISVQNLGAGGANGVRTTVFAREQ